MLELERELSDRELSSISGGATHPHHWGHFGFPGLGLGVGLGGYGYPYGPQVVEVPAPQQPVVLVQGQGQTTQTGGAVYELVQVS